MNEPHWYEKLDKIHPYPAKYPLRLADEYIKKYSRPNGKIYDPFVGSGTTLLSASILNRFSVGTDINPIAVLISKMKITDFPLQSIKILNSFADSFCDESIKPDFDTLVQYGGIEHWFSPEAIRTLSYIKKKIETTFDENTDKDCRLFCYVVFSSIINIVSNQESDTRYAAVKKNDVDERSILQLFEKKMRQIIQIFEHIQRNPLVLDESEAFLLDSKQASTKIGGESVDMIMTSPPYPNTYDYYLYHKHRMLWLGYESDRSKKLEIGSRNEFSSRRQPPSNFTDDLCEIMKECDKVLKTQSKAVIVIGDGVVRGELFDSRQNTINVCESIGWKLIESTFTELDETSRSFNKTFRNKGKREHILVFEKV